MSLAPGTIWIRLMGAPSAADSFETPLGAVTALTGSPAPISAATCPSVTGSRDPTANSTGSGNPGQVLSRGRSEEHTSELQSLMRISYAVFCLKKKNPKKQHTLS